jgi:molecular chaperone Hsp33
MLADHALRAITDDGAFRVMAVQTTETVRGAARAQGVRGDLARLFADLLTGAILVRETMAPDLRVQGILQGRSKKSRLIADAHPGGDTRGLVQLGAGESGLSLGAGAVLQMMRTLQDGRLHQGIVEFPSPGGISEALMQYMQRSEQIFTVIAVGTVIREGEVHASGGYAIQLLPEAKHEALQLMTERMSSFEAIESLLERGAADPERLLAAVLEGMAYTRVGESELRFHCGCSEARVTASLASLPRSDIKELVDDGRVLDITCDFCGHQYHIAPESLRALLTVS